MKTLLTLLTLSAGLFAQSLPPEFRIVPGSLACGYAPPYSSMVTVPTCAKNAIVFKGQPQWKVQAFCERCSTDPTNLFTMYKLETEVLQVNVAQQSPLCAAGVNITMSGATTQDLTPDMPAVHGIQAYMRAVAATLATWTGNYVAYCNGTAIDLRQPPIPLVCI